MIYKRCSRCGSRVPAGTTCPCRKNNIREYAKPTGIKKEYHTQRWKNLRQFVLNSYDGLDIYMMYKHKETWITAEKALELGFIDKIENSGQQFFNCVCGVRLTDEIRNKVKQEKEAQEAKEQQKKEILGDLDRYGI